MRVFLERPTGRTSRVKARLARVTAYLAQEIARAEEEIQVHHTPECVICQRRRQRMYDCADAALIIMRADMKLARIR